MFNKPAVCMAVEKKNYLFLFAGMRKIVFKCIKPCSRKESERSILRLLSVNLSVVILYQDFRLRSDFRRFISISDWLHFSMMQSDVAA